MDGEPWWAWRAGDTPFSVGAEEELMILAGEPPTLASAGPRVCETLPPELGGSVSIETHASALEIQTGVHATVPEAARELGGLRAALARELEVQGLRAASAGTHPLALGLDTTVSPAERYQYIYEELGALARREPTFALHVHVGLPDAAAALRAYNALRAHVPLLIGLSANSPFWRGRDAGLASARTVIFDAFPRTGPPRAFASYDEYVEALDVLIRAGAIPEPTFVWWDLRLQPALGTLEVRAMDAQPTVADTAALMALVQCLVREAAGSDEPAPAPPPEVLAENHFAAARDGVAATLIEGDRRVALGALLGELVERCRPHALALGCEEELEEVSSLAGLNGAERQRRAADEHGVSGVAAVLADAYARNIAMRPVASKTRRAAPSPTSTVSSRRPSER